MLFSIIKRVFNADYLDLSTDWKDLLVKDKFGR